MAMFMHPDFDGVSVNNKNKLVNKNAGQRWKELKRYGCWCWVNGKEDGKTLTQGLGKPVDEIDPACKRLYQCYQCAESDFGGSDTCNYVSTRYDKSNQMNTVTGVKSITCNEDPGTCENSLCECDRAFAMEYGAAVTAGVYNADFHQDGPTEFDPYEKDSCSASGVKDDGDRECCGSFPSRFPMVVNDERKCCEGAGKSYDPNMHECCNDEVVAYGSCP